MEQDTEQMYEMSSAAQAGTFFLSSCIHSMRQYALTNDHGGQDSLIYYWLNSAALTRQPRRILWLYRGGMPRL